MKHRQQAGSAGFSTARLQVAHWNEWLKNDDKRKRLEERLAEILTQPVLAHLPASFELGPAGNSIQAWVSARSDESDVYLVLSREESIVIGLVFLVNLPDGADIETIHIGYLLAESAWGKGLATELVSGLVSAGQNGKRGEKQVQFVGGVGKNNIASAKVLTKSGFIRSDSLSTPDTDIFVFSTPKTG